jgi:hypothetical protein
MSFTHTTQVLYKTTTDGVVITQNQQIDGGAEQGIDKLIAAGASNVHVAMSVTVASIISLLIYATAAVTIKTNSSSSPAQTLTVAAGQLITWNSSDGLSNPLTTNITDFYFSNSGGSDSIVKLRFLVNA